MPSKLTSKIFTHAWFTKTCKSKVRIDKKLYIKAKRTDLTSDWNKFQQAAAVARKTCKQAYNNFVSKALSGIVQQIFLMHLKPKDVKKLMS